MTRLNTSFVLGYHGCEKAIGLKAVAGGLDLIQSEKAYDWLGPGIYFWEGDPLRALEWAHWKKFDEPFVVGAVIDLRNCLDLMVRENLDLLASAYDSYVAQQTKSRLEILENKSTRDSKSGDDKKLRYLDCAVITHLHKILDEAQSVPSYDLPAIVQPFDSVQGLFEEKPEVYPGSGFFKNTHSQIAIRNPDCIVEIFVPRRFSFGCLAFDMFVQTGWRELNNVCERNEAPQSAAAANSISPLPLGEEAASLPQCRASSVK